MHAQGFDGLRFDERTHRAGEDPVDIRHGRDDAIGELVLQRENISRAQVSVEGLCPQGGSSDRIR